MVDRIFEHAANADEWCVWLPLLPRRGMVWYDWHDVMQWRRCVGGCANAPTRVVPRPALSALVGRHSIEFSVKCSYLEIYLEKIRDLLDTTKVNLHVHEDAVKGVYVRDATEVYVTSEEEMLEVMKTGGDNRAVAATGMNEGSSRSHSLFCVTVEQRNDAAGEVKSGRLYLVDLAGSEMVRTGGRGSRQGWTWRDAASDAPCFCRADFQDGGDWTAIGRSEADQQGTEAHAPTHPVPAACARLTRDWRWPCPVAVTVCAGQRDQGTHQQEEPPRAVP